MKKFYLISLLLMCGIFLPAHGFEWKTSITSAIEPQLSVTKDESGIDVSYTFPGGMRTADNLYPSSYRVAIPGFGTNMASGEAEWLVRWDTFEIPENCSAGVSVSSRTYKDFTMKLAPARIPLVDSDDSVYSTTNVPPVNSFSGWLPANPIELGDIQVYRDRNILYVGVYPVSYNYTQGIVRVTEKLNYRVSFFGEDNPDSSTGTKRTIDDDLFGNMLTGGITASANAVNASSEDEIATMGYEFGGGISIGPPIGGGHEWILQDIIWPEAPWYLVISNPAYSEAAEKFSAWKNKLGFNVKTIYSTNETVDQIKAHIADFYDSNKKFQYLLLIGDEVDIPGEYVSRAGLYKSLYTDYYYGCLDGVGDNTPDIAVGRLSVTTASQALGVVNKIISYEDFGNYSAYSTAGGLHCAEFSDNDPRDSYEDRRFVRTSEDILTGMEGIGKSVQRIYNYNSNYQPGNFKPLYWNKKDFSYGELIPSVLRSSTFNWNGNNTDVINAINSGVQYVLHRDHGSINGWGRPAFSINDIASLSNMRATPIVFSMNCETGMYQTSKTGRSTCFAEAFLRKLQGGCVGIIAASNTSFSGNNDVLTMELFQSIWPDGVFCHAFPCYTPDKKSLNQVRRLGDALNIAKINLTKSFTGSYILYTNLIFHCFGDPGMLIRDAIPTTPNISFTETTYPDQTFLNMSSDSKLRISQINKKTGTVRYKECNEWRVDISLFDTNDYFISNDEVPPIDLKTLYEQYKVQSSKSIKSASKEGNTLKISYTVGEGNSAVMNLKSTSTAAGIRSVMCEPGTSDIEMNLDGLAKGIYILEMECDGQTVDTEKIIL